MKQLDLFARKENEYILPLPFSLSQFETPHELESKLSRLNVVEVGLFYLGERISKRPISGNYLGLCPFHGEKTPSFYLKPRQNIFKCYGCGTSGGPLRLDLELGEKIYTAIAEKAGINDLMPFISLHLPIEADLWQASPAQQEYITLLREAFRREQKQYY